MTLLQNDVRFGVTSPSLRHRVGGRVNPQAERALDIASIAGLDLYEWQAEVLADAMRLDERDRWAAREVAVVVPRQSGKGSILECRQVAGLVAGERLQVHSAHEFKTCYEHFRRVKDLIEGCELLADQVAIVRTGAGDQAIELKNGCRIRFIARSRSSGRGFSADVVYLDEAFKLDDQMMGALMPTLSARPNAQIWYTSSAPHADSTVLHRIRQRALEADDPRLYYVEWGNEPDADPLDRVAWARANPSMGLRIDVDDIAAEQRSMSPVEFSRERLGIPEPPLTNQQLITIPGWHQLADKTSRIESEHAWAVSVSNIEFGPQWAAIGKAGRTKSGKLHVEFVEHEALDTGWVVPKCVEMYQARPIPIRVHDAGPEGALIERLEAAGVEVERVSTVDARKACGDFIASANEGQLAHLGQPSLNVALSGAKFITTSAGAGLWTQHTSVEITPLMAVTIAAGGVTAESWLFT